MGLAVPVGPTCVPVMEVVVVGEMVRREDGVADCVEDNVEEGQWEEVGEEEVEGVVRLEVVGKADSEGLAEVDTQRDEEEVGAAREGDSVEEWEGDEEVEGEWVIGEAEGEGVTVPATTLPVPEAVPRG